MMKEFKGTKGEWRIGKISNTTPQGCEIHFGDDEECITDYVYNMDDAKLIAAAPDLLEALQEIVHLHSCEQEGLQSGQPSFQEWMEAYQKGVQAINKALGDE